MDRRGPSLERRWLLHRTASFISFLAAPGSNTCPRSLLSIQEKDNSLQAKFFMQAARLWAVGRSWQCVNLRRVGRHSGIQSFSPKMEAGIKGGFETIPVETVIDLITVMPQKYMGD